MNSFKIKDILGDFPDCSYYGDPEALLSKVESLQNISNKALPDTISWISDKNLESFNESVSIGLFIMSEKSYEKLKNLKCNFLVAANPRAAFQTLLALRFADEKKTGIESTASIHPESNIGAHCYIGHHVVIEKNVTIGEYSEVLHNTVIMRDTKIGKHVRIGANTTIGNYGFGYEKGQNGKFMVITHIGNVVIEDHVEIGNNTAVDRAVMGSTLIRKNAKIDNLVHIAHGVEIGENSLIIANAMIAGSVKIGKNAWVAPSASVLNKKTVGNDTVIGMGAVVIRDVPDGDVVAGNPAKSLKK